TKLSTRVLSELFRWRLLGCARHVDFSSVSRLRHRAALLKGRKKLLRQFCVPPAPPSSSVAGRSSLPTSAVTNAAALSSQANSNGGLKRKPSVSALKAWSKRLLPQRVSHPVGGGVVGRSGRV